MTDASPVLRLTETAPETVRRLALIVAGLAALIARRFLRDPKFGALVGPLWSWLNRSVQRFGRVRSVAVPARPLAVRRPVVAVERPVPVRVVRVRLPGGRGWLVKALGWEAAGYGSQLQTLLDDPEMVALLAALPAVGRVLRPLGRMLGVPVGPVVVKVAKVRVARVRRPRPRREKPWSPGRSPVSWWGGAKNG